MMKPTAPALLRAVEHVMTGYADRMVTRENARRGADATPPRMGSRADALLIRRPRRMITHAELIAVANRWLDGLADGIAPPLGKTLKFEDTKPAAAVPDDDES
jgi:hypothetical protein